MVDKRRRSAGRRQLLRASTSREDQGFRREEVRRGLQQPLCRQVEVIARRVFCLRDCIVEVKLMLAHCLNEAVSK